MRTIGNILQRAIKHYGVKDQLVVANEEMAELSKELCKAYRQDIEDYKNVSNRKAIAEEYVDVVIMLIQVLMIFELNLNELLEVLIYKLQRLDNRIDNDKERAKMILSADEFRAKAPLYYRWKRRLLRCKEKIKEIDEDMAKIPSSFPEHIVVNGKTIAVPKAHGDPHQKEVRRIELIEEKAKKEREYSMYLVKIAEIDNSLINIIKTYDTDKICMRKIIEDIYIKRKRIEDVAAATGYSKSGLYDLIDKTLRKSLDPEYK